MSHLAYSLGPIVPSIQEFAWNLSWSGRGLSSRPLVRSGQWSQTTAGKSRRAARVTRYPLPMSQCPSDELSNELEDKPWFCGGLAFECTQCGNCCSGPGTGYVWVSDAEIQSLASAIGMADDIATFERKFTRRVGSRVSLVEYSDGDCIFLDQETRGCSVYESRPNQCRSWPFWSENLETPKSWAKVSRGCPGCNQGKLYPLIEIQSRLSSDQG